MSVQTEIDRIIGLVGESHEKVKAKGGTTNVPYLLANLPGAIESIPGGAELPELTNPGTAGDLASGKQLIDADGNVVEGNVQVISDEYYVEAGGWGRDNDRKEINSSYYPDKDIIVKEGAQFTILTPLDEYIFGNAKPEDVAQGVTFTSSAGAKLEGTVKECKDVYETPSRNATMEFDDDWKVSNTLEEDVLLRKGTTVHTWFPQNFFGNASPERVEKGFYFTSNHGLKIEGTMEPNNGVELPELTNPGTAGDLASGKQLIDADGNVVTGTALIPGGGGRDIKAITIEEVL